MADNREKESVEFEIDFGSGVAEDGRGYEPPAPRERTGGAFRPLKQDGLYKVKFKAVDGAEPSAAGNNKMSVTMEILDEDEKGATLYDNVTVSGTSKPYDDGTGKMITRPNIWNLFGVLLSAGRTQDELNGRVKAGIKTTSKTLAADLLQEGKNVGYVRVRHEIQTMGKNAGKERPTVAAYVLQAEYDKATQRRWDKKLGATPATSGANGAGVTPPPADIENLLEKMRF